MTRKREHFARACCPVCGDKAIINCRRPEQGQCFTGTDQPVVYQVWQVQCFTGCRFHGPEHIWMIDRFGDVCKGKSYGTTYQPSPDAARQAALDDWNKLCRALRGVFKHG